MSADGPRTSGRRAITTPIFLLARVLLPARVRPHIWAFLRRARRKFRRLQRGAGKATYHGLLRALPTPLGRSLQRTVTTARMRSGDVVPVPAGHAGTDLPESQTALLLILTGMDNTEVAAVADGVAALQRRGVAIAPVFVADSEAFAPLRSAGYLLEYVPPRCEWDAHMVGLDYDDFLSERIAEIASVYGTGPSLVVTDAEGLHRLEPSVIQGLMDVRKPASR